MKKLMNTNIIKSMDKIPVTKNTVPFEVEAPKKLNYHESDVLLLDLADLVNLKPIEISENEKLMTEFFLQKIGVDIDSNVIVDITTNPFELACFYIMVLRSSNRLNRNT